MFSKKYYTSAILALAFFYPKQSLGATVFAAKKMFSCLFVLKARKNAFSVSNVPAKIHLAAKAGIADYTSEI